MGKYIVLKVTKLTKMDQADWLHMFHMEACFRLQGDANNLHGFEVDHHVYLL